MVFKECVIQTLKQDPAAFPHPNLKERQRTIMDQNYIIDRASTILSVRKKVKTNFSVSKRKTVIHSLYNFGILCNTKHTVYN